MSSTDPKQPMTARRGGALRGEAHVPGDKSISHRALILGAMSIGETRIEGLLEGEDVLRTAEAMRRLGARVTRHGHGSWSLHGVGVGGFQEPEDVIDCGNSGTGARLIMGAVATHDFSVTFTGDASLRSRPMRRITEPLARFGASASGRSGERLPLTLRGASAPLPIEYETPVASAQVKSAVLLAALNAPGESTVIETAPTRDHTERMLRGFGATLRTEIEANGRRVIKLLGEPELAAQSVLTPRDPSSAAFPLAAALIVEGSEVVAPGVGVNPTRTGLFDTLREMGADLAFSNEREEGGEPVADITAKFSNLTGIEVPPERAPTMIDEYPILAVAASVAEGETVMRGVGELRVKETDRIAAMAEGLRAAGVDLAEEADALIVRGRGAAGVRGGVMVASQLDHRIAMSFAVLGLVAQTEMKIDDSTPISTSFPCFLELMRGLGADLSIGE